MGEPSIPSPVEIARALARRVVGQGEAVREMSVALAKKLARIRVGNILLIGSSGSGKTTLMQAVEQLLASSAGLESSSTLVRIHASVLGEEAGQGGAGDRLLRRLLERARQQLGPETPLERLLEQVRNGIVFVDEVDKIRSVVGRQPNVSGIRAQEALLTLIENEAVPFALPEWAGGGTRTVDSSSILFVCAGAFEGLYDAVYQRVTVGRDKGALRPVTVVEEGRVSEELRFSLRDWLRHEDLFEYGISPQFLSRFDAVVLLEPLSELQLLKIFIGDADSGLRASQAYFASLGCKLEVTTAAARRIAREAARQPRLGARALKEVFRRVISPYEFDPRAAAAADGSVRIDVPEVEKALQSRRGPSQGPASQVAGWDASFPTPEPGD